MNPGTTSRPWLERIAASENLATAWDKVRRNAGAPGVDGMTVSVFDQAAAKHLAPLHELLLAGRYHPQPTRAVDIPKPGGGTRTLGIPTVADRVVQQAVAQVLTPVWEPLFSPSSHAYRPGRDALDAVAQVLQHLTAGLPCVVDLDIEKFFDHVHHARLLEQIAAQVPDADLLALMKAFLEAGCVRGGFRLPTTEGTPQGSPLSPLLANIVLDALDQHLDQTGRRFARYADDLVILCPTEAEAHTALEEARAFLRDHLHLSLNESKTRLCTPPEVTFLGFAFQRDAAGAWRRVISAASMDAFRLEVDQMTARDEVTLDTLLHELAAYVHGWENYYRHPDTASTVKRLRAHARTAVRRLLWRQWATPERRVRELTRRGVSPDAARDFVKTCPDAAMAAASPVLGNAVPNAFFASCGLGQESAPAAVPYGPKPTAPPQGQLTDKPGGSSRATKAHDPSLRAAADCVRPGETGIHLDLCIGFGRFGSLRGSVDLRLPFTNPDLPPDKA